MPDPPATAFVWPLGTRQQRESLVRLFGRRDTLIAVGIVLTLLAIGQYIFGSDQGHEENIIPILGATVPIMFALRRPRLATSITVTAALTSVTADNYTLTVGGLVGLLVVCAVAAYRTSRWWDVVVAVPFLINAVSPFNGDEAGADTFLLLVLVVAALMYGDTRRTGSVVVAERDASVRAHATTLREHALLEERGRIAHELHDVVAHHISMIAVQAETARLTTAGLSVEGQQRFSAIGDNARAALEEMRRLLGVMRNPDTPADRDPLPGLDQLHGLIDEARAVGTDVRFSVRGPIQPLTPTVELVTYRVVQEALTNARRHAPGSPVDIGLDYHNDRAVISIRDHGPGATTTGSGYGLAGMRERVEAVGGALTVGNHLSGGFWVTASLPIGPTP